MSEYPEAIRKKKTGRPLIRMDELHVKQRASMARSRARKKWDKEHQQIKDDAQ